VRVDDNLYKAERSVDGNIAFRIDNPHGRAPVGPRSYQQHGCEKPESLAPRWSIGSHRCCPVVDLEEPALRVRGTGRPPELSPQSVLICRGASEDLTSSA